ncbi:WD40 repeat domain-containing protein [Actinoplanes sp. NPDC024001]|uniref:WD40 repeat domain-containing protein n=1 Tax=Actinoplanes sp. NPDC024001 TaxID=3154598 RepID=UPI00340E7841
MRILWTTGRGPDPALRQVFRADRPSAVAAAVVDGAEVLVTLTDEHEDFDCELGELHETRCPEPGLRVWERATGRLIRTVPGVCDNGTGFPAQLVTVQLDGRPFAVVGDWSRPPKLVDLSTGERAGSVPGPEDIHEIAGTGTAVVTAGWDGILRIGETVTVDTGEKLTAVAVVPVGGRPVVATGSTTVTLWDPADGSRLGVLGGDGVVTAIDGWPDTVVARGNDGWIAVWDEHGRRLGMRRMRLPGDIAAITTAGGRRLLAVEDGEAVTMWDVDADEPFGAPLSGPVTGGRLVADGLGTLLVASARDDAVSVWQFGEERPGSGAGAPADLRCLAVTPDGWIVAGASDGSLTRWRLSDGVRGPDIGSLDARVNAIHAEGAMVAAVGGDLHDVQDDRLHRWVDGRAQPPAGLGHGGEVTIAVRYFDDGPVLLTAGCDGSIHLTDLETGQRRGTIEDRYPPRGVAVGSLGGRPVAAVTGMFEPFTLWDLTSRTVVATPAAANVRLGEAARAWAGNAVVTVHEGRVRMHDLLTGSTTEVLPGVAEPVTAVAAAGLLLAIGRTDGSVTVVEANTGRVVGALALPYAATVLTWAPQGRLIAACRRDLFCIS